MKDKSFCAVRDKRVLEDSIDLDQYTCAQKSGRPCPPTSLPIICILGPCRKSYSCRSKATYYPLQHQTGFNSSTYDLAGT